MQAIIFDVDGTLIDSVDLHARAWQDALEHFGHCHGYKHVRDQIGKGGDELLHEFLDQDEFDRRADQIKDYRAELFKEKFIDKIKPFPDVRKLFEKVRQTGLRIAIGSSAKEDELDHYLELLDVTRLVDVKTSADDTNRAKPHPDIFEVCLEKLGIKGEEALVIGDTPYDALAATRAEIPALGFLCGGFEKQKLLDAGMREVYDGPSDLLARFEDSPLAVGGKAHAV